LSCTIVLPLLDPAATAGAEMAIETSMTIKNFIGADRAQFCFMMLPSNEAT
jgi:hypothetical protein